MDRPVRCPECGAQLRVEAGLVVCVECDADEDGDMADEDEDG